MTKPFPIPKRLVWEAFTRVKANGGAAGVDAESIEMFESKLSDNLYKLWNRLCSGSYFPPPVRGVPIPKKAGGVRMLGVPTVADRVAQTVVKGVLEPVLEPCFHRDSFGYRPGRSALDAVAVVRRRNWAYDWVVEFDIRGLFDNIDHALLLKAVRKHCLTPWVLLYIERWLKVPMEMEDGTRVARTRGTPQGGVLTPRTQKVIGVRLRRERPGAGRRQAIRSGLDCADGNRVADRERVAVDQDLFYNEPEDLLALADVQGLGARPQCGAEPGEGLGELQIIRVVHRGHLQRVELRRNGVRLLLEVRHPLTQLGQRRQAVLIGAEEPLAACLQAGLLALQLRGAGPAGSRAPGGQAPARDLGVDQRRVVQHAQDLAPDEGIERILPDGAIGTHRALEMAVAV